MTLKRRAWRLLARAGVVIFVGCCYLMAEAGAGLNANSLAEELMPVATNWRMLGRKLGLEEYQLEIVDCEKLLVAEKLVATLDQWLRKKQDASWTDIFHALKIMQENTLAEEIGKKHSLTGSTTEPAVPNLPVKKLTETNYRKMKTKFFGLVGIVSMTLNKKMSMELDEQRGEETFQLFRLRVAGFCNAISLAQKRTVLEIFATLLDMNHWDLDGDPYELLLGIAEAAGDKEIIKTVEIYQQEHYTHYLVATQIVNYIALRQEMKVDKSTPTQANLVKLSMKLGGMNVDESSLAYLTELWKSVKRCVSLPDLYSTLASIEEGCVSVTWFVPTHAISALTRLPKLAPELLTRYEVTSIHINGVCIYNMHAKVDSKEKFFDEFEDDDNDKGPTPQQQLPSPKSEIVYDIELVHETDGLRCPICLQVLRDPMQVKCCGKRFCQACIERVISKRNMCPHCNTKVGKFEVFEDKAQQQTMLGLKVYCRNRIEGCDWTGELCQQVKHLKEECQYSLEECVHCSARYLLSHVTSCPQQPYTCPYCKQYSSTYENVFSNHFSVCREFPVRCKLCSKQMSRKDCQQHIMEFSGKLGYQSSSIFQALEPSPVFIPPPNMTDHCSYWYALHYAVYEPWFSPPFYSHIGGYKMQLKVDAYGQGDGKGTHVSVFVYLMRGEFDDNLTWPFRGEVIVQLVNQEGDEGHVEETFVFDDSAPTSVTDRVIDGKQAPSGCGALKFIGHNCVKSDSLEFQITQIIVKKLVPPFSVSLCANEDEVRYPFYSHTGGYKMQLLVCTNGRGSGENTHVSIFIFLMRGEFDDDLSWPFQGKVMIQLVNQRKEEEEEQTITFDISTSDKVAGRVTEERTRAPLGLGYDQFISHSSLTSDQRLRIAQVEIKQIAPKRESFEFIEFSTPV